MAERRMFSKRIVNSGKFLKMQSSTRALYYQLGIDADDDGVVEAYQVITSTGATEDDLKILAAKGFVKVLNEDLVTYITDWNENNKIRADRKIDSIYKDLLIQMLPDIQLIEKKPRSDTKNTMIFVDGQQMDGQWTVHGQTMDGQWTDNGQPMDGIGKDRIGEDRIGEDRIGEDRIGEYSNCPEAEAEAESADYQRVVDAYNSICVSFPSVKYITDKRKKAIKARLNKYKYDYSIFDDLFRMAEESDFLKGSNGRNWSADFDWLICDANMAKVLEGKYANNKQTNKQTVSKTAEMLQSSYAMFREWAEE